MTRSRQNRVVQSLLYATLVAHLGNWQPEVMECLPKHSMNRVMAEERSYEWQPL